MKGKKLNHPLSARIKKIMQADEDVGKIAQATPVLLGRAVELFLKQLCDGAVAIANSKDARTLSAAHLKAYVMSDTTMDFLKQTMASAPDIAAEDEEPAPKPKRRRKTAEEGPGSPKPGRGRGKKAAAKQEDFEEAEMDLREAAAANAEDAPAGVKPEDVSTAEVHNPEGHASREEPAAAVPPKQEDIEAGGDPASGTESAQPVQPALAAAPLLPIGIPAAAAATIAEEDDYDDFN
ncbi:hypothetical protein COCSUDRAFT_52243 [Coccomyxa subellipsoidea C-169]|uniref:Transcription factor CBF/NF-Y/archaeal histone domain-containing protein n=1 Tax=Coccomyxa subellipsoidea (strain C-169) TaxID=574566 RepID=I0ZAN0_COCSC|nr:hypothetical protein COCSUDRAFT_52243 [Coccomyxa subellipsoidea C-169]EIE27699.1 hypothetical protein COCSUDRAFT_52243 [Coccomyxa subellipsoidea C-169]|eukprot:XP_005652243.1 hypothetical protein COCSUDRAFT_52243 [Coccomyxa subellipsoidea C-169]